MPVDRSARAQLQALVGDLGQVQPFRWTPDSAHRYTGWWMTPAAAVDGCACAACEASRAGRDLYIGSIARACMYDAQLIVLDHTAKAAA